MEHLYDWKRINIQWSFICRTCYLMVPGVLSTTGIISTPFSTIFVMLKTARDIAQEIHNDASARFRLGQMRLPKPKHTRVRGSCYGPQECTYRGRTETGWDTDAHRVT